MKDCEFVDTTQTVTFVAAPKKAWPLVLGASLMAALCGAVVWPLLGQPDIVTWIFGWIGVFFFGGGALMAAMRSLGISRTRITLSPQGFVASQVTSAPVPWSAVLGVRIWSGMGMPVIVVKVMDETWRNTGIALIPRLTRAANRWLGIDGLAISAMHMPIGSRDLLALFRAYAAAHKSGSGNSKRSTLPEDDDEEKRHE